MKIRMDQFLRNRVYTHNDSFKTIVHVGASYGEEVDHYLKLAKAKHVLLIEPLPDAVDALYKQYAWEPRVSICHSLALDEKKTVDFHVTTNSVSSSIYGVANLDMHSIKFHDKISVSANTLDNMIEECYDKEYQYGLDLLVIDAQGSENLVLAGAKETLRRTKLIFTEASETPLYEGACVFSDIDKILTSSGFELVEKYYNERGTGDVVYKRIEK